MIHTDAPTSAHVLSTKDRDLLLRAEMAALLSHIRAAVAAHRAGQPNALVHLIGHLSSLGLLPAAVAPEQLLAQAHEHAALVDELADRILARAGRGEPS